MKVNELPANQLAQRLRRPGVLVRLGPFVARLGTSLPSLVGPVRLLYAHYELVEEGGVVDFAVRVDPPSPLRRWVAPRGALYIDGLRNFEAFEPAIAPAMLEWAVNWCTFTRPHQFFMLHSAVVEKGGLALLLPGPPGAGKSTLCAALSLRGWRLLSDELVPMRPGTLDVVPVPRPVGLKEGSIEVIRRFEPAAVLGPVCPDTRKGDVAHLQPSAACIQRSDETARPRWIVFPNYAAGQPVTLTPASKAETLLRLADDAFNFSLLGQAAFDTLADMIDHCDCCELTYGDLNEAIAAINELASAASASNAPAGAPATAKASP
jgi:HprK-related kinase A